MGNAQARGHGSRWVEGHVKTGDHAAENIDRHGDPGAANRLARDVVHEDDVHFRVIDLDHAKRGIGHREVACDGFINAGGLAPMAALRLNLRRYRSDPAPDCIGVRRRHSGRPTARHDFDGHLLRRRPLASEVNLVYGGLDDLLNIAIQTGVASVNARCFRQKRRKLTGGTISCQPSIQRGNVNASRLSRFLRGFPGNWFICEQRLNRRIPFPSPFPRLFGDVVQVRRSTAGRAQHGRQNITHSRNNSGAVAAIVVKLGW
jgi:hypothetical protein